MIRAYLTHFTRKHHAELRDAWMWCAMARMAGFPLRRAELCFCGKGYVVHLSREVR